MRFRSTLALVTALLLSPAALPAQKLPSAASIVKQARTEAAEQNKVVFVVFTATWCDYCQEFDSYLEMPTVRPIIDKYFVVVHVNVQEELGHHPERNHPGGARLLESLGGGEEVPYFALLKASGGKIADANAPRIGNVGFPEAPEEVDWFMVAMIEAVPTMTPGELDVLDAALRKHSWQNAAIGRAQS